MKPIKSTNPHLYYALLLNLGMLFISTSGVLGRYIALPPPVSIWFRSLIAIVLLVLYARYKKFSFQIHWKKHGVAVWWSGFFMAVHWITYFFALQWSNVAIGMLSLFTYPIITVFLEPFFMPVQLQKRHLLLGTLILVGIYFLVPEFDLKNTATQGLLIGLFSALAYSLRNLILKKHNAMGNGSIQMIYQLGVIVVLLLPVLWIYPNTDLSSQWPYLLLLGAITTALGHTLFLSSFAHFSISTASIMSSIQPLFGVLLGALFLSEIPDLKSILGGVLILTTVVLESRRARPKKN
ncbi:DMT family transporter [Flavobacteriaceae bacterium]|jgi:drug/metabolite transporter (DMT)-like permease|nr:DMT family transporter [Flavobacteriaceae bacterium]MDA8643933.1 DMT family transporter [Flavobacteriaceae bacterium]MDA8877919.1 DMT family transporter [Flavobacteriaceae bacterium]MDA9851996.1 DMT family transporter [Flavobacteriaceae bacterium]